MFNISTNDERIIKDIVTHYDNKSFIDLKKTLLNIFTKDIKPEHFICLGVLIGKRAATFERRRQKLTNQLCLRQN